MSVLTIWQQGNSIILINICVVCQRIAWTWKTAQRRNKGKKQNHTCKKSVDEFDMITIFRVMGSAHSVTLNRPWWRWKTCKARPSSSTSPQGLSVQADYHRAASACTSADAAERRRVEEQVRHSSEAEGSHLPRTPVRSRAARSPWASISSPVKWGCRPISQCFAGVTASHPWKSACHAQGLHR